MNAPELQRDLQIFTGFGSASIDQVFRVLRADKQIPTSPRGGEAVELTDMDAALALCGLAADVLIANKAKAAQAWFNLPAQEPNPVVPQFTTAFGVALARILGDTAAAFNVREVRVCRDWPWAQITVGTPAGPVTFTYGTTAFDLVRSQGYRAKPIRSEVVMPGGVLHQLAIDLAGLNDGVAEIIG